MRRKQRRVHSIRSIQSTTKIHHSIELQVFILRCFCTIRIGSETKWHANQIEKEVRIDWLFMDLNFNTDINKRRISFGLKKGPHNKIHNAFSAHNAYCTCTHKVYFTVRISVFFAFDCLPDCRCYPSILTSHFTLIYATKLLIWLQHLFYACIVDAADRIWKRMCSI